MKVCPNCHTPARFEAQKFCAVCGHRFEDAGSAPQAQPAAPAEAPGVTPAAPQPVERRRPAPAPVSPAPEVPAAPQPVERRRPAPEPVAPAPEAPETPRPVERRRPAPEPVAPAPEVPAAPQPVERRRPAPEPVAPAPEVPEAPQAAEPVVPPVPETPAFGSEPQTPVPGWGIQPDQPQETPAAQPGWGFPAPEAEEAPPQNDWNSDMPPIPPLPPEEDPAVPPTTPPQAWQPRQEGSNRKVLFLVLGIVAAVLVVVILAVVLLRGPIMNAVGGLLGPVAGLSGSAEENTPDPEDVISKLYGENGSANSQSTAETEPLPTMAPIVTPAPTPVTPAVASDTQVVFRNAAANGTITVDGVPVEFTYVGNDAVIPRTSLADVCQVRIVAPAGDGTYQTAAVWYNQAYGNDLTFGGEYGAYVPCDENGLAKPSDKMVDVLTWAFYRGFLDTINTMDINSMKYSTAANTTRCAQEINGYLSYEYDLSDFTAVCDPTSIQYNETDGTVIYNGHFVSYHYDRGTTNDKTSADVHRTLRLVWEDGMWKVDAFMRLDNDSFNAGRYAALP